MKVKMEALAFFCDINMGQSPKSETYNDSQQGLPFYQGNADFGEVHPAPRVWCDTPIKTANAGDILISVRAPIGALNIAAEQCCIGRGLAALTPKYEVCGRDYLRYALESRVALLQSQGTGSTFKAISKKVLESTEIPFYEKSQQENIVRHLSKVDSLIKARKEQMELLEQLVKSRFIEMFGDPIANTKNWEMARIEDVVSDEKNALKAGPFGSALKKEFYVDSGYKIYGQEQVISGDPYYGDYYIDEEKYNSLKNCSVQAGDVLISLVGTYGKLLIIPDDFEPGIINPRLMKITFDKEKVNPIYFKYFFQSDALKASLEENTHGGTMGILNLGIVRKIALPVPPIKLQDDFIDFVARTDTTKAAIQQSLDHLETLKRSLMQDYFG